MLEYARGTRALAINGRFLGQPTSGVQRYGRELIRAIDAVLVRAPDERFASVTVWVPPDVPETSLPADLRVVRIRRIGRLKGHLWEQFELRSAARGAILLNLTNSAPLLHPCQLVTIHDAAIATFPADFRWQYRAWYKTLYGCLRRSSARFISVSGFAAGEVSRHFRIGLGRITVAANAAEHFLGLEPDNAVLERLGLSDRSYILAVGGRAQRKNLGVVNCALEGLEAPPVLVVAGGQSSRAFIARDAASAHGSVFLDHISDAEIKALYQGALCLVFPSRYEGFGLPPLEAMTCGCPVIVSRAASMPEICGDAVLYCDPDRAETVTSNIRSLLTDPALRHRLIQSGLERSRLFSWQRSATKVLDAARRVSA